MLHAQRHAAIAAELTRRGTVSSTQMAERLGVSAMTIRRDLEAMEAEGQLSRVYGGAVAAQAGVPVSPPASVIGMILPSSTYYFRDVIAGARKVARERGVRIVLGDSGYSPQEELRQTRRILAAGVDGLLITPSLPIEDSSDELFALLHTARVPVVLVERALPIEVVSRLPWVRTDHAHGAEAAVEHLAARGCQTIALAYRHTATTPEVVVGYRRAIERLAFSGLEIELAGHVAIDNGSRIRSELASHANGRLGVLVLTDADAIALASLADEEGVEIPRELAIVAYDDELAALATVPLTAVAPPKLELGATAMRICLERGVETAPPRITLLPKIVERESTESVRL